MTSEQESLIQQEENSIKVKNTISMRHLILIPSLLFTSFGTGILGYVINEWTQLKNRNDYFPNLSPGNNFSACGITNHSDETYIKYKTVQQDTAMWMIYYNIAYQIPAFFCNMILPGYTDAYGRKFLFVLVTFGLFVRVTTIAAVIYSNEDFIYVAVAYAVEGITGGTFSLLCCAFSFVADITFNDQQRVIGVVVIEALLMVTSIFSSLLSGYFIQTLSLGFSNTAFICVGLITASFFINVFFLPETLSEKKRVTPSPMIETAKRTMDFYVSKEFKGQRLCYILLLLSFCFAIITNSHRSTLETLYFLGQPFCWDPQQISYFVFARHACLAIIGLGSISIMQRCMSNEVIAILSTVSNAGSFVIEAFATTTLMIYMVPLAGVFSFLMIPMIRGIMSTMTPPDKQGSMFASIAVVENMCSLVASTTQNMIYSASLSFMNGFVFLVVAFFCVVDFGLLLTYCYVKPSYNKGMHKQSYEKVSDSTQF